VSGLPASQQDLPVPHLRMLLLDELLPHGTLRCCREFLELGFKYDNLLMEESAQILEIETFIPMLLQASTILRLCPVAVLPSCLPGC
jgi:hypothetical protein